MKHRDALPTDDPSSTERKVGLCHDRLRLPCNPQRFLGEATRALLWSNHPFKAGQEPLCCIQVTAVLYTSTGWQQRDGGMLRLWQPPGTHRDGSAEEIDIEPLGGRLVLFLSGAVDHAVQPSQAVRVALTAWMT